MSQIAVSSNRASRRYNWCPRCNELWLAARMAGASCPVCDGHVLPYIGRSPYDIGRTDAHHRPERMGRARVTDTGGPAAPRSSTA